MKNQQIKEQKPHKPR